MTIPVPSVKYNLLEDSTNKPKRIQKTICLITIITITLLLTSLCAVYYVFGTEELKELEFHSIGRPELYSLDEFLNKETPCTLCDTQPNTLPVELSDAQPPKLVCYYSIPDSLNDSTNLMPEDIDCNLCTHINIGFADVFNNSIVIDDIMKNMLTRIIELKSCNSQLKLLFTVGSAHGDSQFPAMVSTHASRKVFIRSLKAILRQYKLDGVDLDWEFPVFSPTSINSHNLTSIKANRERQHFSQLLREIRAEYVREKRPYLLTVAVAAPEHIVHLAYDVNEINQYADFINLMTYDLHLYTKFTPFTGLNSPLYNRPDEILYFATLNVNYTANLWLNLGMDRNKIVVGLPTYGHTYTLVNKRNGQIGSPASGVGSLGTAGFINSTDVCDFINNNTQVNIMYDNQTSSPYFHKDYEWVSYENRDSIASKGRYVKESNFGGVMVYSLNNDDYTGRCSGNVAEKFYLTRQLKDILLDNDL